MHVAVLEQMLGRLSPGPFSSQQSFWQYSIKILGPENSFFPERTRTMFKVKGKIHTGSQRLSGL